MKSNCPSLAYIPKNPIKEKLLYMLLLVDQYSSGTVSSQTIHMSRELFMLPQWHVKTHNITYSSQLIVYLDLELVENHFLLFWNWPRNDLVQNGQNVTGNKLYRSQVQSTYRRIYIRIYRNDLIQRDILWIIQTIHMF